LYIAEHRFDAIEMTASESDAVPDYATLASTLQRCAAANSPSEAHGFALGLAAARVREPYKAWCEELYADLDPADVLAGECTSALDSLFSAVFRDDDDAPMQLALLLPQDIQVNAQRLVAVRDWCQGFLFGFGLGGQDANDRLSEAGRGFLHDVAEFTRMDIAGVENTAENQAALIDIEEYLREGAMLMCEKRQRQPGGA
jgi:uncharacterized protein YgfB (UPF0149 family)